MRGGTVSPAKRFVGCLVVGTSIFIAACGGGSSNSSSQFITPSAPPAVTVAVAPSAVATGQGGTLNFAATVAGSSNTSVLWSVQEGAAGGTITSAGVYTAPFVAVNPPHIAMYHVGSPIFIRQFGAAITYSLESVASI